MKLRSHRSLSRARVPKLQLFAGGEGELDDPLTKAREQLAVLRARESPDEALIQVLEELIRAVERTLTEPEPAAPPDIPALPPLPEPQQAEPKPKHWLLKIIG